MKSKLREAIQSDIYRYYGKYKIPYIIRFFHLNPGLEYMISLRKTKYYKDKSHFMYAINRLNLDFLSKKYLFQIPYSADIGLGFYIGHFGSIIINSQVSFGSNINIAPGVTIGQTNRGPLKGSPSIGNDVWIGTNAVIVGKIVIGDDVMIAPNSYVNFVVPSHSIVIGNPGKIIHKDKATEYYINNKIF